MYTSTLLSTKKIVLPILTLLILIPNLAFANESLFYTEKVHLIQNEELENVLGDSQNILGAPEGTGMVLGLEDIDLDTPKYLPLDSAYAYMAVVEGIKGLFIIGKENKLSYLIELAEKRLSEINQATKNKKSREAKISLKKAVSHYETIYEILKEHGSSRLLNEDGIKTISNHMTILTILAEESVNSILQSEFDEALKFIMLIQLENDKL